jgi:hypothetical protein
LPDDELIRQVHGLLDDAVECLSAGASRDELRRRVAESPHWQVVKKRLSASRHDDLYLWLEELTG